MTEEEIKEESQQEEEKPKGMDRSLKVFLWFVGFIILIFVVLILLKNISEPKQYTVDELITQVVEGEENDEMYQYNGFAFVKVDGLWYTRIHNSIDNNPYLLPLHFSPPEVENVTVIGEPVGFYTWAQSFNTSANYGRLFITFNPDDEILSYTALANNELLASLIQVMKLRVYPACDRNSTACGDALIITCDNTDKPVVYLNDTINYPGSQTGRIDQNGNCLTVSGSGMELVRAVNKLVYMWYGIIK